MKSTYKLAMADLKTTTTTKRKARPRKIISPVVFTSETI